MSSARALIVWAHPRTRSTMTERCFIARDDIESFHEPMGDPFYWGPERTSPRFTPDECAEKYAEFGRVTFASMWKTITTPPPGKLACFSKDMAKFIFAPSNSAPTTPRLPTNTSDGNPTWIPTSDLLAPGIVHVFLIRSPKRTVPSWFKLCTSPATGFGYFDPEEVGVHETRRLYDFIASRSADPPLVIDSDSIVDDPARVVKLLCKVGDIDYREDMLDWESSAPKAKALFGKYPGWHVDAENSTGVQRRATQETSEMPKEVLDCIDDNMEDYNYLKGKAYVF